MSSIPIQQIKLFLYNDAVIRNAIIRDYGLDPTKICNSKALIEALMDALNQRTLTTPEAHETKNNEVFKAVVLAIASGSNRWVEVQKIIPRLASLLNDFDPVFTSRQLKKAELKSNLVNILGGQAARANTNHVLEWSSMLTSNQDFYREVIVGTYNQFSKELEPIQQEYRYPIAVLCLAGILANPVGQWKKFQTPKLPGMGVPIACEFLRNLGWSGFKPDRHICRAINLWEGELNKHHEAEATILLNTVTSIINSKSKETMRPIRAAIYAILATELGPDCKSYSEADNVLWAFISNVLKYHQNTLIDAWIFQQLKTVGFPQV